jgi:AraC-like DNA-binding protein
LPDVAEFVHDLQVPLSRPVGIRAGFHAELDSPASGLTHAGEQWAPARFLIRPHTHPAWELYLQVHGVSRWAADGRRFALAPGHLFGVAPRVRHHMVAEAAGNHHFYYVGVDPGPALARHPGLAGAWAPLPPVLHRADAAALAEPFQALIREVTTRRAYPGEGLALTADRLLLEVTRLLTPGAETAELAVHPAVARVRDLLERDYRRAWTLTELATTVGLSPTYLAGLFARDVGQPPHRYLTERRLARARQLLRASDLSTTAIALEVGLGSGQHLARLFRRDTGTTPGAYRRRERQP